MNYEQLKADMEAGTQGDWVYSPWYMEEAPPAVKVIDWGLMCTTSNDIDARRIARVPQLERIALAAEAMSKALGQLDKWFDTDDEIMIAMSHEERVDHVYQHHTIRETLAAYREATK